MDDYLNRPYPSDAMVETKMARMPTLQQRLDMAVKDAESRLEDAKRARDILSKHPELEELMNIMQKGRF